MTKVLKTYKMKRPNMRNGNAKWVEKKCIINKHTQK